MIDRIRRLKQARRCQLPFEEVVHACKIVDGIVYFYARAVSNADDVKRQWLVFRVDVGRHWLERRGACTCEASMDGPLDNVKNISWSHVGHVHVKRQWLVFWVDVQDTGWSHAGHAHAHMRSVHGWSDDLAFKTLAGATWDMHAHVKRLSMFPWGNTVKTLA